MVYIRSRTFCCCIPVRFGVFILSLICFLGGLLVSIVGWIAVSQIQKQPLPTSNTIGLWLHAILFTILTLLSLFGFIGCFVRSRNSVRAYSVGIVIILLLSIASGAYYLWTLFHKNSESEISDCLNGGSNSITKLVCKNGINVYKAVNVAIYVVLWFLMFYAFVIVDNYVEQLEDEMSAKETRQMLPQVAVAPVAVPAFASYQAS